MRRFTLRLPETLFQRLELLASGEGVSLNQYLLYSLAQHTARAYQVFPVSQDEIKKQREKYEALIKALGTVSDAEFDAVLAEGELAEPEAAIAPELAARIEAQIAGARAE